MAKRYCAMCDEWVNGRECPACGADTDAPIKTDLDRRHAAAVVPPYAVRKQLREATLKVGR